MKPGTPFNQSSPGPGLRLVLGPARGPDGARRDAHTPTNRFVNPFGLNPFGFVNPVGWVSAGSGVGRWGPTTTAMGRFIGRS